MRKEYDAGIIENDYMMQVLLVTPTQTFSPFAISNNKTNKKLNNLCKPTML